MTLITTSRPFDPPASYLKLHMPSFSLFQYAPVAECIPRRPVAEPLTGDVGDAGVDGAGTDRVPEVGCCMIVELTANLKLEGAEGEGADSEMRDFKMEF